MGARDFLRLGSVALLLVCLACDRRARREVSVRTDPVVASAQAPVAVVPVAHADQSPTTSAPKPLVCPDDMRPLPGGSFWVGSDPGTYSDDESPRYRTEIAAFCMDTTEVTVEAYVACVVRGACSAPHDDRSHCNTRHGRARPDRDNHPINCVDWFQAKAFCEARGARLPSEAEWEYAARGGEQYLDYPWGNATPDGHACWKHDGTCPVRSFEAGAFGLFDVSGNVWEWTADWYGPYPWPPADAYARVYRGGSWSRRFEKWMHTRLRDRDNPSHYGSHLGFRCVTTPASVSCPFGRTEDGAACLHGVVDRPCSAGTRFNGVRCAHDGDPRCGPGRHEVPGHGCVLDAAVPEPEEAVDRSAVTRERSAEFDADCGSNAPGRPHAWRYIGGTHRARNLVSGEAGCKNRDVGVGYNSTCCP